jgi:uncharacterized protein YecE (DUF72 family)
MIWSGTSGFQYPDWKGKFYPPDLSAAKMLAFYAERFPTTEINYTFRRIPSAETIAKWGKGSPDRFRFSFKAPQRITHFARLVDCEEILQTFIRAIVPMKGKLGVVLLQLPPKFKKDAERLRQFLKLLPREIRFAFEFRNVSWFDDEITGLLKRHNIALCIAEDKELAIPSIATADFGYLRLRREDYTPAQLRKWAAFVKAQSHWREVFAYFKHEEQTVGPRFATRFWELMKRKKE